MSKENCQAAKIAEEIGKLRQLSLCIDSLEELGQKERKVAGVGVTTHLPAVRGHTDDRMELLRRQLSFAEVSSIEGAVYLLLFAADYKDEAEAIAGNENVSPFIASSLSEMHRAAERMRVTACRWLAASVHDFCVSTLVEASNLALRQGREEDFDRSVLDDLVSKWAKYKSDKKAKLVKKAA